MKTLLVKALPSSDNGRHLVRLNTKYRNGVPRFGIVSLKNKTNNQSCRALVLGHDDEDCIFMPFDIRTALGVEKGGKLKFEMSKLGLWGKLCWLLESPDPAVYLPGWLAILSVILGVVGILTSFIG